MKIALRKECVDIQLVEKREQASRLARFLLLVGASFVISNPALAVLGGRANQTALQSDTGDSVLAVCLNFVANNPAPGSMQDQLFTRCTEMVQTALEIDGQTDQNLSLGLTNDGLNAALQQLATEEANTATTMGSETSVGQASNVLGRMAEIRAGVGSSVARLMIHTGDQVVAWQDLPAELRMQASGGGAGSDSIAETGKLSFFLNGSLGTGDREQTDRVAGFDFDTGMLTAGFDYRVSAETVFGAAVGYNKFDSDLDTSSVVAGGSVDADGFSLSLFGTHYVDNWYLQGVIGYGQLDYDLVRRIVYPTIDRTATASTEGDYLSLSIGGGYDIQRGPMTITPYVRLDYLDLDVDSYTESGAAELNLIVGAQDTQSTRSVLGVSLSNVINTDRAVWIPYGRIDWIHEFDNDQRTISSTYFFDPAQLPLVAKSDSPDRNYFSLGLGVSSVYQSGTQAFLQYETVLGLDRVSEHVVSAGMRLEF